MNIWGRINGVLNSTGRLIGKTGRSTGHFIAHSGRSAGQFVGNAGETLVKVCFTKEGLATLALIICLPLAFRFSKRGGGRDGHDRSSSSSRATVVLVDREEASTSRPRVTGSISITPSSIQRRISRVTPTTETPSEEEQYTISDPFANVLTLGAASRQTSDTSDLPEGEPSAFFASQTPQDPQQRAEASATLLPESDLQDSQAATVPASSLASSLDLLSGSVEASQQTQSDITSTVASSSDFDPRDDASLVSREEVLADPRYVAMTERMESRFKQAYGESSETAQATSIGLRGQSGSSEASTSAVHPSIETVQPQAVPSVSAEPSQDPQPESMSDAEAARRREILEIALEEVAAAHQRRADTPGPSEMAPSIVSVTNPPSDMPATATTSGASSSMTRTPPEVDLIERQITPSVDNTTPEAQMRVKMTNKVAKLERVIQSRQAVYNARSLYASDSELDDALAELNRLRQAKQDLEDAISDTSLDLSALKNVSRRAPFIR